MRTQKRSFRVLGSRAFVSWFQVFQVSGIRVLGQPLMVTGKQNSLFPKGTVIRCSGTFKKVLKLEEVLWCYRIIILRSLNNYCFSPRACSALNPQCSIVIIMFKMFYYFYFIEGGSPITYPFFFWHRLCI